MALIEIRADLSRVAKALEKIAELLERIVPPEAPSFDPSTDEDVYQIPSFDIRPPGEDDLWMTYGPRRNY